MIINTIELENFLNIKIKSKFKKEIIVSLENFVKLNLSMEYGKIPEEDYLKKYNSLFSNKILLLKGIKEYFNKEDIILSINPNYFQELVFKKTELNHFISFMLYKHLYRIQRLKYINKNEIIYGLDVFKNIINNLKLPNFYDKRNSSSYFPYNRIHYKENSFIKLLKRKNNYIYFKKIYEEEALKIIIEEFNKLDFLDDITSIKTVVGEDLKVDKYNKEKFIEEFLNRVKS